MGLTPTVKMNHGLAVPICDTNNDKYDAPEFNVTTATTDYDVATNEADSFSNVKRCTNMIIRTTQNISVKLNSTSNGSITVNATDSPYQIPTGFPITNIYISNASGSTATIRLFMV